MAQVNKLVMNALAPVYGIQPTTKAPRTFSAEERDAVGYFYLRLHNIYQETYRRELPNEEAEQFSKREWAGDIARFNREQISAGMDWIRKQQVNAADKWEFMNIGRCIGAIRDANRTRPEHQLYKALPIQKCDKETGGKMLADIKRSLSAEAV